jgi:hypothetical protein
VLGPHDPRRERQGRIALRVVGEGQAPAERDDVDAADARDIEGSGGVQGRQGIDDRVDPPAASITELLT